MGADLVISYQERGANSLHYGPTDATATPSSLASLKNQNSSAFLTPAYPGCILEKRLLDGLSSIAGML